MSNLQSNAVKAAGDRLEAIEAWSRRTFIAATVGAVFLGVMTAIAGYIAVDYIRLKYAAAAGIEGWNRDMKARNERGMPKAKGGQRPPF